VVVVPAPDSTGVCNYLRRERSTTLVVTVDSALVSSFAFRDSLVAFTVGKGERTAIIAYSGDSLVAAIARWESREVRD
jgi:hypothetical protein